jgi:hypothetical protein
MKALAVFPGSPNRRKFQSHHMELLGAIGTAAQLAELAAEVFTGIYEYYRLVKAAPAKSRALRDEVLTISNLLEDLSVLVNKGYELPDSLKDSLSQFGGLLKSLDRRVVIPHGRSFKRLKWPFTEEENKEYLCRIQRYISIFSLAVNTSQA